MRRAARVLALLLGAVAPGVALARDAAAADFDEALRLVGEGRLALAIEAADAEPDPLRRAQARLWVRYHAGDLPGALRAGLAGLEGAPADAWLLGETAEIAANLRLAELTAELGRRFAAVAGPAQADRAAALAEQGRALVAAERARDRALGRARLVVGVFGAGLVTALLVLGRAGGGARSGGPVLAGRGRGPAAL